MGSGVVGPRKKVSVRSRNFSARALQSAIMVMKLLDVKCLQATTSHIMQVDLNGNVVTWEVDPSPWFTMVRDSFCYGTSGYFKAGWLARSTYMKSELLPTDVFIGVLDEKDWVVSLPPTLPHGGWEGGRCRSRERKLMWGLAGLCREEWKQTDPYFHECFVHGVRRSVLTVAKGCRGALPGWERAWACCDLLATA